MKFLARRFARPADRGDARLTVHFIEAASLADAYAQLGADADDWRVSLLSDREQRAQLSL